MIQIKISINLSEIEHWLINLGYAMLSYGSFYIPIIIIMLIKMFQDNNKSITLKGERIVQLNVHNN
uniref:Uncharacterized protein n=1 Tax=Octopus bimaculoides TaxID=37653 RepID=A0A0L8G9R5_OCTBM